MEVERTMASLVWSERKKGYQEEKERKKTIERTKVNEHLLVWRDCVYVVKEKLTNKIL